LDRKSTIRHIVGGIWTARLRCKGGIFPIFFSELEYHFVAAHEVLFQASRISCSQSVAIAAVADDDVWDRASYHADQDEDVGQRGAGKTIAGSKIPYAMAELRELALLPEKK
jgi:hypothetical protein